MEIRLITLGLFIVLLLPASFNENGLTWAAFAISIILITLAARRLGSAAKQQTKDEHQQDSSAVLLSSESRRSLEALIRTYR